MPVSGREDDSVGKLYVTNGGLFQLENVDGLTDFNGLRFGRNDGAYGYGKVSGADRASTSTRSGLTAMTTMPTPT